MRLRAIILSVVFCLPLFSVAQEAGQMSSRGTIYGGYALTHNNSNNFNGWDTQGTFNFTRHFGVTADFTGDSHQLAGISALGFSVGANQHLYTYLFGPTVTSSFGKSSVFGHALFGVAHSNLSGSVGIPVIGGVSAPINSANAFAMEFGGGIDIGVTRHFAIRAAQVDYLRTNFNSVDALTSGLTSGIGGNGQNSFRYSGGVVWRW
jgi:opacity protein-like surface antigen